MALFETEEVSGNSPYKDLNIGDKDNGYTVGFLFLAKDKAVSAEYGEFSIWQGVSFDPEATTEKQLLDSLELASLIPNTMLKNFEKNGAFKFETPYILTKAWSKGDKYEGNKRAKGHGWKVEKVKLPTSILSKMIAFHNDALNIVEKAGDAEDVEAQPEAPTASGVRM